MAQNHLGVHLHVLGGSKGLCWLCCCPVLAWFQRRCSIARIREFDLVSISPPNSKTRSELLLMMMTIANSIWYRKSEHAYRTA